MFKNMAARHPDRALEQFLHSFCNIVILLPIVIGYDESLTLITHLPYIDHDL